MAAMMMRRTILLLAGLFALLAAGLWVQGMTGGVYAAGVHTGWRDLSLVGARGSVHLVWLTGEYFTPDYMLARGQTVPLPDGSWRWRGSRFRIDADASGAAGRMEWEYLIDWLILPRRNEGWQWARRLGFDVRGGCPPVFFSESPPFFYGWQVSLPLWFIAIIAAIFPAHGLAGYLRIRRRRATGLCIHCGYDLRATPDRCPECGRVPETAPADTMNRTDTGKDYNAGKGPRDDSAG